MVLDSFAHLFEAQKRIIRLKSLTLKGIANESFQELVRSVSGTLKLQELTVALDQVDSKPREKAGLLDLV
jgi:hypothetical protein